MSQNPAPSSHLKTSPPGPLTPPKFEDEWPTLPRAWAGPTSGPSERPENKAEERGDAVRSEEEKQLRRDLEDLKRSFDKQRVDMEKLKRQEEELRGKCKRREDWIAALEHEIGNMRGSYQRVVEGHTQRIRALEKRLEKTEERSATRSAELSGTQTFLSTADRLSEVEVLDIVRDLNENIYQVAVGLTEEWEKLEPPRATSRIDADPTSGDPTSGPHVPALVRLARNRDPTSLTFLLQSYLCSRAADITSSWGRHKELAVHVSVYQHLSASGEQCRRRQVKYHSSTIEGQAISATWRTLTHNSLSPPPPDSALLVKELADILGSTGSFPSTQQPLELVRAVALEGIQTIIRLCLRLERTFVVEVISRDTYLLVEAPDIVFDDARMADEYGSDGASTSGKQDRVAGTTEVGVGKSMCGGPGKGRHVEILLKTKVVLEKDVVRR